MPRRVSIKDIAERAGVSTGTVSNVLNHPEAVADATRQAILAIMADLNFVANASARQLRVGASQTVGVVVMDISNPFYTELARGIEDRLAQDGLLMMLCSSDENEKREASFLRQFSEQGVLGVLVTPFGEEAAPEKYADLGHPTVLLDADSPTLPSVSVDHVDGARQAVKHLLDQGHARISFVNGPLELRPCRERAEGVRLAIADHGLDPDTVLTTVNVGALTAEFGKGAASQLLADDACTAIFCANDLLAMGVSRELRLRGLAAPGDVAVVGYDDIAFLSELMLPLTSVRQPMHDLGWTAVDMLLRPQDHPKHVSFAPTLVVRESSVR
ncbi:MAG: LacI family transcriptional regulator [Propionibacteriaceae bacterium]|jgi:LacI family transcriptional regulator|nr:LacI family transcriptional regulator [Propionibacteriaceae bacterium]